MNGDLPCSDMQQNRFSHSTCIKILPSRNDILTDFDTQWVCNHGLLGRIYYGVPFVTCSKFDEDVEKVNAAQVHVCQFLAIRGIAYQLCIPFKLHYGMQEDDGGKDSKKRLSISNKKDKDFIAFVLKRLDS